jgi:acyl carrier protein
MTNKQKYDEAFINALMVETAQLPELRYQAVATWDSVGHMALIASIESAFGIELDIDDIVAFSSYEVGQEILVKYNIHVEAAS